MKIEIPFEKGDKMIVLNENKFTVETFSGEFTVEGRIDDDGNLETNIELECDRMIYDLLKVRVSLEQCFHSVTEAMEKTGLVELSADEEMR